MKLQIHTDNEIALPDWLGSSSLTLSEIGAVVCLACVQCGNMKAFERMGNNEGKALIESLKAKGILSASLEAGVLKIDLDLDAAYPTQPTP